MSGPFLSCHKSCALEHIKLEIQYIKPPGSAWSWASSGRMLKTLTCRSVCSSVWPHWLLHYKIMIVCLFGLFSDWNGHFTDTNINGNSPPSLCSLSMHTTEYPINSFTIYNYLFSLSSRNKNIATKRGIKLGLFSRSKNKNDIMSVFWVYQRNHINIDYLAELSWKTKKWFFSIYILHFQLRVKPY